MQVDAELMFTLQEMQVAYKCHLVQSCYSYLHDSEIREVYCVEETAKEHLSSDCHYL